MIHRTIPARSVHLLIATLLPTLVHAVPVLSGYSGAAPTTGGTPITLTGSDLGNSSEDPVTINFGTQTIPVQGTTGTTLIFFLPPSPLPPAADTDLTLSVTKGGNTSNNLTFNYDAPAVGSIAAAPPSGWTTSGGQTLTISGTNFGRNPASLTVTIGGSPASDVAFLSPHAQITVTTPEGVGLDRPIAVTRGTIPSSPAALFDYNPPVITEVSPPAGIPASGASIQITGTDFGPDEPSVTFHGPTGGIPGAVTAFDQASITVTKPETPVAAGSITVTQAGGQTSTSSPFTPFTTLTSLPGYYVDLDNAQVLPAPAGTYADATDLTEPIDAQVGKYAPVPGMRSAIETSPGYFNNRSGFATQTPAPPGGYCPDPGMSTSLTPPMGKYSPVSGMRDAIPSDPGYYVVSGQTDQQVAAPPGRYIPNSGATTTSIAERGYYTPVAGMRAQLPANPGFFVAAEGADSQTPANPGRYVPGPNAQIQLPAEVGHYVPFAGMQAQIPADPGFFVPDPGADYPTAADLGRIAPGPKSINDQPAPKGTYAPIRGLSEAIPANPGYYVPTTGSSEQTPASVGKYTPNSTADIDLLTPPGTYAPIQGLRDAIPAPEGTYSPNIGSTNVLPVPAGATRSPNGAGIVPISQVSITAYTKLPNGDLTLTFASAPTQHYEIYSSENLLTFDPLGNVTATAATTDFTFTPPASPGPHFYFVRPAAP